jgi:heterodisulfide reductase subunit B
MKYAYYPGCSLHSTANEYELSTQAVCKALSIELEEIEDWNCCGATSAHSLNRELSIALPLRNLAKAEQMGLDVVTPCAACFNRLRSADAALRESPEMRQLMAEKYGIKYDGKTRVLSLLEAVSSLGEEAIRSHVKRDLSGLKVACYYGCLLIRPPDVAQFDDPEAPMSLDNMMTALGAEPVTWPYKNECCGASLSISKSDVVVKLSHDILSMAKRAGANCMATACPLCQGNLDMRQADIEKKYGEQFGMPIFYFTQLMGLAFGLWEGNLGLKKLMVDPGAVLAEIGRVAAETE